MYFTVFFISILSSKSSYLEEKFSMHTNSLIFGTHPLLSGYIAIVFLKCFLEDINYIILLY